MDGAAAALGAWWASIRGFFTPATLFLVVNLVIGTIALTSRSHQRRRRSSHDEHQEPLRNQENHQYCQERHHEEQQQQREYVPPPAPLARTSSVLDRLRSIGLYRFRSGDFPPEYAAATTDSQSQDAVAPAHGDAHYGRSLSEPAPVREKKRATPLRMKKSSSEVRKAEVAPAPTTAVVQAAVLEEYVVDARADEFTDNFTRPPAQQEEEEAYYPEEYVPPLRPAPLARTSSVLDRLRSFSLYRFRSGDLAATDDDTPAADDKTNQAQAAHYTRSRSEPGREQNKKQQQQAGDARTMTKSSSAAPRKPPSAAAQEEVEPESVDARADNFINSFRQQLQLQRLNSLLNYKEMLNRGAK